MNFYEIDKLDTCDRLCYQSINQSLLPFNKGIQHEF